MVIIMISKAYYKSKRIFQNDEERENGMPWPINHNVVGNLCLVVEIESTKLQKNN